MRIKIKGLDKLNRQLKAIPGLTEKAMSGATYELTETIATNAISNVQAMAQHPSGELAGSIQTDVSTAEGKITGSVFTLKDQGMFFEFGTGPVGQASQKDLPEGINPVYRQTPWFIPADKVDRDLNALYGIPVIEVQGKKFYFTHGQPARPFMYPAYKQGMEQVDEIFKEHASKALREGL